MIASGGAVRSTQYAIRNTQYAIRNTQESFAVFLAWSVSRTALLVLHLPKEQAAGWGGALGGVAVSVGKNPFDIIRLAVTPPDLGTHRRDRPDHLMAKGVGHHLEDNQVVGFAPPRGPLNGSDRRLSGLFPAESTKVMFSDEVGGSTVESIEVQRVRAFR